MKYIITLKTHNLSDCYREDFIMVLSKLTCQIGNNKIVQADYKAGPTFISSLHKPNASMPSINEFVPITYTECILLHTTKNKHPSKIMT